MDTLLTISEFLAETLDRLSQEEFGLEEEGSEGMPDSAFFPH